MHVINCIGATEDQPLGTMLFFQSFGSLIMIEDAGQALWRRWSKAPVGEDGQVAVGYAWVSAVIILLTPWYQYSAARLPADKAGAVAVRHYRENRGQMGRCGDRSWGSSFTGLA
jgi:hypothetical protein